MDSLEAARVTIVDKMAICEFYAQIYDEGLQEGSWRLPPSPRHGGDAALKDLYAAVQAFLDKAKECFGLGNSGMHGS